MGRPSARRACPCQVQSGPVSRPIRATRGARAWMAVARASGVEPALPRQTIAPARLVEHAHRRHLERDIQTDLVLPHGSPPQGRSFCRGTVSPAITPCNGPISGVAGGAAVPRSDGVSGVRAGRPQASPRDRHGLLCRDRRLAAGTAQRVRGGRDGEGPARGPYGAPARAVPAGTGSAALLPMVASAPEALVDVLRRLGLPLTRVGLEAGPLSPAGA